VGSLPLFGFSYDVSRQTSGRTGSVRRRQTTPLARAQRQGGVLALRNDHADKHAAAQGALQGEVMLYFHATTPNVWDRCKAQGFIGEPGKVLWLMKQMDAALTLGTVLLKVRFDPALHAPNNYASDNTWNVRVRGTIPMDCVEQVDPELVPLIQVIVKDRADKYALVSTIADNLLDGLQGKNRFSVYGKMNDGRNLLVAVNAAGRKGDLKECLLYEYRGPEDKLQRAIGASETANAVRPEVSTDGTGDGCSGPDRSSSAHVASE